MSGVFQALTRDPRRRISSKIATARMPGAASSIGTISSSHTPASGSARRRPGPSSSATATTDRLQSDRGGGRAQPGLRGGDGRDVAVTGLHVQPRLAVGDMLARQALILLVRKNDAAPNRSDRQTASVPTPSGKRAAGLGLTTVGLRPPFVSLPRRHSHPDCRSPLTLLSRGSAAQKRGKRP